MVLSRKDSSFPLPLSSPNLQMGISLRSQEWYKEHAWQAVELGTVLLSMAHSSPRRNHPHSSGSDHNIGILVYIDQICTASRRSHTLQKFIEWEKY